MVASRHEGGDAMVTGFLDQTRNVLVGVNASIDRALQEGWSMVLEGVHLVPGMLALEDRPALVVQCVLAIDDEADTVTVKDTNGTKTMSTKDLDEAITTQEGPITEETGMKPTYVAPPPPRGAGGRPRPTPGG